jgi:hypothetical protein
LIRVVWATPGRGAFPAEADGVKCRPLPAGFRVEP